jgi:hypothetical protein
VAACIALLGVYVLLSFGNDPRGSLGTDTGGKLATLAVMKARGSIDPDIGYWAERLDPQGTLHPLYYTAHVGDRWVNVTTLPMMIAAWPLDAVGGLRFALLVPMLGGVLSALCAGALAARLRPAARWPAFWIVGLASPVALYALDFWEHSVGLGLMLAAVVALYDALERDGRARGMLAAGLLFGAAATMRTEALVYLAVAVTTVVWVLVVRGKSRAGAVGAVAMLGGAVLALAVNQAVEWLVLGTGLRAGRAAGTAANTGAMIAERARDAAVMTVGVNAFSLDRDLVLGGAIVVLLAAGAICLRSQERIRTSVGAAAVVVALLLYAVRFVHGDGFVPGLLVASPFAAAGLGVGWRVPRAGALLAIALAALPVVWCTQYSGGAFPQWGGRYTLLSGALLAVIAVAALVSRPRALAAFLVVALAVTAFGLVSQFERTHAVADAMASVVAAPDGPVISREVHVLREGGAFYSPGREWLTAARPGQLHRAVAIVAAHGDDAFDVLQFAGRPIPRRLAGYGMVRQRTVDFLPGLPLDVLTYRRSGV